MEEDFILPEGEEAVTSNKTFLLTALTLLTTLIVLSLGVIALLLLDRQDKLAAIPATPTSVPTVYQDDSPEGNNYDNCHANGYPCLLYFHAYHYCGKRGTLYCHLRQFDTIKGYDHHAVGKWRPANRPLSQRDRYKKRPYRTKQWLNLGAVQMRINEIEKPAPMNYNFYAYPLIVT